MIQWLGMTFDAKETIELEGLGGRGGLRKLKNVY